MKILNRAGLALALSCGLSPLAWGQVPAVPAAPAVPGVPGAAPGATAAVTDPVTGATSVASATGGGGNLWSFFCMTPAQKAACKERFCRSTVAKFLQQAMAPARLLSGGNGGGCCPAVLPSDLAQPADSAGGAAARIKADEAAAKARRADVRYLGTVDCRYWPEAKAALINSLRADRNECVRFEAALAFQRGCCCNKDTIRALTIAVNCSDEDGNPREASSRVREAAMHALQHCVDTYCEVAKPIVPGPGGPGVVDLPPPRVETIPVVPPIKPIDPVRPPEEGKDKGKDKDRPQGGAAKEKEQAAKPRGPRTPEEYYQRVRETSWDRIIADAKAALAKHPIPTTNGTVAGKSLTEVVSRTMSAPLPGEHPRVVTGLPLAAPVSSSPVVTTSPVVTRNPVPVTTTTAAPVPAVPKTITTTPILRPAAPVPASTPAPMPVGALPTSSGPVTKTQTSVIPAFTPAGPSAVPPVVRTTFTPTAATPDVRPAFTPAMHSSYQGVTATPQSGTTTVTFQPKERLLVFFNNAVEFQHRQWAATQLGLVPNGGKDDEVVSALLKGAEKDTAATVRVACLDSMRKLGVTHAELARILPKLQADPDVRVRHAATEASNALLKGGSGIGSGPYRMTGLR